MTFLPHLVSHDPLGLSSHILGFSSESQRVSWFPGERAARGPVAPVGWTLWEVSVVVSFAALFVLL